MSLRLIAFLHFSLLSFTRSFTLRCSQRAGWAAQRTKKHGWVLCVEASSRDSFTCWRGIMAQSIHNNWRAHGYIFVCVPWCQPFPSPKRRRRATPNALSLLIYSVIQIDAPQLHSQDIFTTSLAMPDTVSECSIRPNEVRLLDHDPLVASSYHRGSFHHELRRPLSPLDRTSRKRAASLSVDNVQDRFDDRDSAVNAAEDHVCLCQPDPKIPRPRNAFILYRQHFQAQVLLQHPGLANPEISKIIGEQWKGQPEAVKEDWKRLAEEEKLRHQRQYPGYRYQPRRAGKAGGAQPSPISPADESACCPKCGGRYITAPSTPNQGFAATPFGTSTPGASSRSRLSQDSRQPGAMATQGRRQSNMSVGLLSPRALPAPVARQMFPMQTMPVMQPHRQIDEMVLSPGSKRRRIGNERSDYAPQPPSKLWHVNGQQPAGYQGGPEPTNPNAQYVHGLAGNAQYPNSVAGSGQYTNGTTGSRHQPNGVSGGSHHPNVMAPTQIRTTILAPPQPSPMFTYPQYQSSQTARTAHFEDVRLPPLRTPTAVAPVHTLVSSRRPDNRRESRVVQARSIEAMISTISATDKITTLARIAPPLACSDVATSAASIRGSIIAVEGTDIDLTDSVGTFLNTYLDSESTCYVKTWTALRQMPRFDVASPTQDVNTAMIDLSSPTVATSADAAVIEASQTSPFAEYLGLVARWHRKSKDVISFITSAAPADPSKSKKLKVTPIALFPRGFSVMMSDHFAIQIPINDSYSALDHWQWMATLWRGIVGPDFTVLVKRSSKEEIERKGAVEMKTDWQGCVVRIPEGEKMDEKTGRRLGFEVLESVRAMDVANAS